MGPLRSGRRVSQSSVMSIAMSILRITTSRPPPGGALQGLGVDGRCADGRDDLLADSAPCIDVDIEHEPE